MKAIVRRFCGDNRDAADMFLLAIDIFAHLYSVYSNKSWTPDKRYIVQAEVWKLKTEKLERQHRWMERWGISKSRSSKRSYAARDTQQAAIFTSNWSLEFAKPKQSRIESPTDSHTESRIESRIESRTESRIEWHIGSLMEHQVREHNSLALSRQHSAPACRTAIGGVEQFAILERFPSTGDELQQSIRTTKRNAKAEKKPKTSSLRYLPHIPNGKHLNRARFWEIKKKFETVAATAAIWTWQVES